MCGFPPWTRTNPTYRPPHNQIPRTVPCCSAQTNYLVCLLTTVASGRRPSATQTDITRARSRSQAAGTRSVDSSRTRLGETETHSYDWGSYPRNSMVLGKSLAAIGLLFPSQTITVPCAAPIILPTSLCSSLRSSRLFLMWSPRVLSSVQTEIAHFERETGHADSKTVADGQRSAERLSRSFALHGGVIYRCAAGFGPLKVKRLNGNVQRLYPVPIRCCRLSIRLVSRKPSPHRLY